MTALQGLRVVEIAGPFGGYCGKMLAGLGADVVLVEPPAGAPGRAEAPFLDGVPGADRSFRFAYENTGKRSIVLDLDLPDDAAVLRALAARADILIEAFRPGTMARLGLGYDDLRTLNDALVYVSITGFGQTGPYADYAAADVVALALGGMMSLAGYPGEAPLAAYGGQAVAAANMFAGVAALAAVLRAEATGEGEHVDVSMQECVALGLENAAQFYDLEGVVRRRQAGTQPRAGNGLFECADGSVFLMSAGVGDNRFWFNTVDWLEAAGAAGVAALREPCWSDEAYLATAAAKAAFLAVFHPFAMRRTKRELYVEGQRWRVPICPVQTPADVVADPQLRHRGFFVEVAGAVGGRTLAMPGAPYRLGLTPWAAGDRAPLPGEHTREILAEFKADGGVPRFLAEAAR